MRHINLQHERGLEELVFGGQSPGFGFGERGEEGDVWRGLPGLHSVRHEGGEELGVVRREGVVEGGVGSAQAAVRKCCVLEGPVDAVEFGGAGGLRGPVVVHGCDGV